jgi:hypothetical protein
MRLDLDGLAAASREALMSEWRAVVGRPTPKHLSRSLMIQILSHSYRCCQTNRLKHQKPWERGFYEAIRERHSVRAASRFSLKVLRFESDLCELK